MGRSSSSRRSGSSSGARFASNRAPSSSAHVPSPAPSATAPVPSSGGGGGGFLSNMAGTMASGMAHGVGFGVAQRAVDAVMGGRKMEVVHTGGEGGNVCPPPATSLAPSAQLNSAVGSSPCQQQAMEFNQCVQNHSDVSLCQHYLDSLKRCQSSGIDHA